MNCKKKFERDELVWINDLYGIPYMKVCYGCYEEVEEQISKNDYGKYLTHDELYGEDDLIGY
jgi:hypothetical protein